MKKTILSLFCIVTLGVIGIEAAIEGHAEEFDINETDPNKVFPPEEVERLVQEAAKLPVLPDPTIDDTGKTEGEHTRVKRNAGNVYPTRKGVILVTPDKWKGVVPTGHAGIIYNEKLTVEANDPVVDYRKNDWNTSKKAVYALTVNKANESQQKSAADWCSKQVKKSYNLNYYDTKTRDKFYCSQLVRSAFLDLYNIDLNTSDYDITSAFGSAVAIHPMELVNSPETTIIYRNGV